MSEHWKDLLPPAGWQSEAWWDDRNDWAVVDVAAEGIEPNDDTVDTSIALKRLLDSTRGPRVLVFPEGDYWFRSPCTLSHSNVILRGAGMDATRFYQDTADPAHLGFSGTIEEHPVYLTGDMPYRGDDSFEVADPDAVNVGDVVKLYQENPNTEGMFGHLATYCWSQIVRIVEKDGEQIRVDMRLGLDYKISQRPRIVKFHPVENVSIEDLYIEKLQDNDDFTLFYYVVINGRMRRVRSRYTSKAHFKVRESRRVIVEDCEAELSHDYGGNGHGYGVVFSDNATRCYAFNNACGSMRHPFHIQRGANHCVYAYNHSWKGDAPERKKAPHDCRLHGGWTNNNLFEGNVAHEWVADQVNAVNGTCNVWFRNHTYFGRYEHGSQWMAIGNEFTRPDQTAPVEEGDLAGANVLANGKTDWGAIHSEEQLPASLCFVNRPSFIDGDWPVFGPDVWEDGKKRQSLPAEALCRDGALIR